MTCFVAVIRIGNAFQSTCHIRGMTRRGYRGATCCVFQSTCHIRGMTLSTTAIHLYFSISIHMPHTWHDKRMARHALHQFHFNPHATYVA